MTDDVRDQVRVLQASFREKGKKVKFNVQKVIVKACLIVERDAKMSMSPNGPSAPGEPPAVDTGRLRASITHRVEGGGYEEKTVGVVGTNVEYGKHLEFGTVHMAARPWLTPALERHRKEIVDLIKEATVSGVSGTAERLAEEGE
jgi:HK97 gp10 family phage protein